MQTKFKPPANLDAPEADLWRAIQGEFSITDPAGLELLASACEQRMRQRRCREIIDRDGEMVDGKAHPLLGTERDRAKGWAATLHMLGLDIEPALPVGRQPQTNTVRRVK